MDKSLDKAIECVGGNTCTTVSTQYAGVSLGIKLCPTANLGDIETRCCGEPSIVVRRPVCVNGGCCCNLVITQNLAITIPIEYSATVESDDPTVVCKNHDGSPCGCNF